MASFFLISPCTYLAKQKTQHHHHLLHSKTRISSCKSTDEPKQSEYSDRRRNILIGGLTSTAVAGLSSVDPMKAFGMPITAPDISSCNPNLRPDDSTEHPPVGLNCCPPSQASGMIAVDFKLPPQNTPLRVRRPAQMLSPDYIAKYKRAVGLMRALPASDPRSMTNQANVHCEFCDGAYDQVGFPGLEIQVHNSWLFFPWHRFYVYFHERILGKLIGDPNFALPFWNWDAPEGMRMPAIYADDHSSPLYDPRRDPCHQPPRVIDLNFHVDGTRPPISDSALIHQNLTTMYRQVILNGTTPQLFMGSPYRAGDRPNPGSGSLELVPHNTVHNWTGDCRLQPGREDMGSLFSAARDPIFYAHHANVDRVWNIWRGQGGRHMDWNDPDFLNASFLFFDENAQLVRVRVRDSLHTNGLRYKYQQVDIPWLKTPPTPKTPKTHALSKGKTLFPRPEEIFPVTLRSAAVSTTVRRPSVKRSREEKSESEEMVVLDEIEFDSDTYVKFDVYINAPDPYGIGPESSEFAGSFTSLPHRHKKKITTTLRLGITWIIDSLNVDGDEDVTITIMPRSGTAKIKRCSIELDSCPP